jgi:hypothetical protein
MGKGIAYLPAWYDGTELVPAGPPILLRGNGPVVTLAGSGPTASLAATATSPRKVSPDTKVETPVSYLATGKTYVLQRWDGNWKKEGEGVAGEGGLAFEGLPADGLYWLVEEGSKKLERIFTIEDGKQRWW